MNGNFCLHIRWLHWKNQKIGRSPRAYRRKSADQLMASKIDINQELKERDYYTGQRLINASIQM